MSGASFETTLELWASSLREVKARIRPLFTQERVAASAGQFLDGPPDVYLQRVLW